jgi:hypothetical protein
MGARAVADLAGRKQDEDRTMPGGRINASRFVHLDSVDGEEVARQAAFLTPASRL